MTFQQMFKKLNYRRQMYFCYRNKITNLWRNPPQTEEEFLQRAEMKSIQSMRKWEQTQEYQELLAKYLEMQYVSDIYEIYMTMLEKAKDGDEKAINAMLKLGKEIEAINKKGKNNSKDEIDLVID